jgi:transcriptional regulator with XRE-family HTH domain
VDDEPQLADLSADAPYWERLRALRRARGLSQANLFRRTPDIGLDTIRALEQKPPPRGPSPNGRRARARYPSMATLGALARALDVDPAEFPEYRLASFRAQFDDRVVELGVAMDRLREIEDALAAFAREQGEQPPPAETAESPSARSKPRTRRPEAGR